MRLFRSLIVYSSPTKKPTASYNAIGKKFLFQPGRQTGYVWQDTAFFRKLRQGRSAFLCVNILSVQVSVGAFFFCKAVDGDKPQLLYLEFSDCLHLLNLPMNFIQRHRLCIVFGFVDFVSVSIFQNDIKLTVFAVNRVIIVIAADISHTPALSGASLQAEIIAADPLKPARDKVRQSGCYILVVESLRPQHLQGTGVFIQKGEIKAQQVVIDFKAGLLVITELVDGIVAGDNFQVDQGLHLLGKVAGFLCVQLVLDFGVALFAVALNAQKDELSAQKSTLSDQKLSAERPYSYSLVLVFFAILLTAKGLYNAIAGVIPAQKADVKKLAQAGLLAALCYIGFAFFKIDIPVGPEKTAFHLGNVFCVLAALLLGGYWGGLAGAIGMTIADLTTAYVTSAPKTFLLKLCIGLIVGLVAHKIFHLSKEHSVKYVTGVTILASACGMAFNVVADPLVGYFYKMYLLGVPQDISKALAKISTVTTGVNAIVAVICASVFYLALRPALKKAGLFHDI